MEYPIIMPTNKRIILVVVGNITCVHWLALLWDIWMTIWLGDYMVAYHELSPKIICQYFRHFSWINYNVFVI